MSGGTDNFIHSLVEMSKAFEELPKVQAELKQAIESSATAWNTVRDRESSIMQLKAEIEALHTRNRELEVERDDAELRFRELDRTANKVHRAIADAEAALRNAASHLEVAPEPEVSVQPDPTASTAIDTQSPIAGSTTAEPPVVAMQEPMAQPNPSPLPPQSGEAGQSAPNPTEGPMALSKNANREVSSAGQSADPTVPIPTTSTGDGDGSATIAASPSVSLAEGQSVVDPIVNTVESTSHSTVVGAQEARTGGEGVSVQPDPMPAPTPSPSGSTDGSGAATVAGPSTEGLPYTGKLWEKVLLSSPGWISYTNWIAGGGTDATYHWRDGDPLPEGVA